ncbi:phosphoribosyl pyrophosphate synthase-associated protein 1-like [Strix aluco]|uniref:phosphoribosyl pyrophosphate synthase-associated protein 1-like n=2 Tax=Strix TaxID=36304 RepID=UPI003DA4A463
MACVLVLLKYYIECCWKFFRIKDKACYTCSFSMNHILLRCLCPLKEPCVFGDTRESKQAAVRVTNPSDELVSPAGEKLHLVKHVPFERLTDLGFYYSSLVMMMAKEKPPITVVGDVGGRIAIIVDDIIDDVESFVAAAEILKERGAYKIFVMATHGLLSADAPRLIEESSIDEVVVTNTVPHEVQKLQCPKIKTVDISLILSEAVRRIHNGA